MSEELDELERNPDIYDYLFDGFGYHHRHPPYIAPYKAPEYDRRVRIAIEEAFHHYLRNTEYICDERIRHNDISPSHSADYSLYYLSASSSGEEKNNGLMYFMQNTRNEVADEINFIEWVLQQKGNISFETMPSEIFDQLLEDYAHEGRIGTKGIEKLKKDYYNTGWAAIFMRIQRLFKIEGKRPQRSLAYVMDRYLSKQVQYNCVILPLADEESRDQFSKLVKDEWQNLNDLSGDALDIYYSESDIGKTGYDIAKRIQSLPEPLHDSAPSIILWKDSIAEAKAVSIGSLSAAQIRNTIKTIVQQIKAEKDIDTIIREAEKAVKKQEALNHGATYNEFSGGKNVVVTDNTGNVFVNQGDNAEFGDINLDNDVSRGNNEFLQEIEKAISAIRNSEEIDEESKEQLVSIMEDAKVAETENSEEKRSAVKKAFGYVKGFLIKGAPSLVSVLANLTKIATFFGLTIQH